MTFVVALFGAAIAMLGIVGLVRPSALMHFVQAPWRSRTGLYLAIGIRVVFGLVLLAAASASRFPETLRILGIMALIAAAVIPVLGFVRLQRFVHWWTARSPGFMRAWSLVAAGFGIFLVDGAL